PASRPKANSRNASFLNLCLLPWFLFGQSSPSGQPDLGLRTTASTSAVVRSVRFSSGPDHTRVVVDLDKLGPYESGQLRDPARLYFDLFATGISPAWKARQIPVQDPLLRAIDLDSNPDSSTRLTLELNATVQHHVQVLAGPPRLVVDLRR